MSFSKYVSMKVLELKVELRARNAKVTGNKKELIERYEKKCSQVRFGKKRNYYPL